MTIRMNPCLRSDGKPKSAFPAREDAQRWIDRHAIGPDVTGTRPYPCAEHGWHVGQSGAKKSHRRRHRGCW